MADLIDRQAAIDALELKYRSFGIFREQRATSICIDAIKQLPSAQPEPESFEQLKWERDLAIRQLADLGYGLGEKPRTNDDLISRQAAIKAIEDMQDCYNGFSDTYDKACIIGVLEELPSAQPEYRLNEWCTDCKEYDHERNCCPRFNHVIRTTLQEVQPERKKGKWTWNNACPFCGFQPWYERDIHTLSFCPNCGARMEGEDV